MKPIDIRRRMLVAAAAGALAASALPGGALAADDPIRISFIQALTAGEWNTEILAGAEAAVADLGFPVDLKVVGPTNFDPGQQAMMMMQETQTAPDALIVTNVAPALFTEPALQAEEAGVKVVWINAAPTEEFADSLFVSNDPAAQGAVSADSIAATLEKKLGKPRADIEGTVLVGLCVPGLSTLENRVTGFRAAMEKELPQVTVLPTIETKPDREGAFLAWSQAMQRTPDALAYVDACEPGIQANIKIIADDGLDAITVAMDSPEDVRLGVRDGSVTGIVNSSFFTQAYVATYLTAKSIHDGTPLPQGWLKIDPRLIAADDIDAYIDAWTDPETKLTVFHRPDIDAALEKAASGNLAVSSTYDTPELD